MRIDYKELNDALRALTGGVPHRTANLANASALIWNTLKDINWAGFYLKEDNKLILGPFQGKPACNRIPMGKGVCGAAWQTGLAQVVPNVHHFPGHIACDSASNSELVIPIHDPAGKICGLLDLDSPTVGRFDETVLSGLLPVISLLENWMARQNLYTL